MEGRIKKLTDRGYGFIEDLDGESFFFHKSELKGIGFDELKEGDLASFDPGENEKGKNATNVKRVSEETQQEDEKEEGGTEEEKTDTEA
ncbi:hypothetical protein ES703_37521 [subsurface metagenome]